MSVSQHLGQYRWYRHLIVFLKRLRFGEQQVSVYHVLKVMMDELKMDSLTKRSSYMAFNFTLAIFPTIIFLFTLIPYIPVGHLWSRRIYCKNQTCLCRARTTRTLER